MMLAVRILVFCVGALLTGWTLLSAVRTVILPRAAQSLIARTVFKVVSKLFSKLADERKSFEARDATWALFAPVALVLLPVAWLTLVTAGYTLMYWGLDTTSLSGAFLLSGSSITTLGFAHLDTLGSSALAFTEAGWGLVLVALLITYLPSMYSAFSTREAMVALMEVRAGVPPSAVEFVLRHHRIGWMARLETTWLDWERFFASVEESHTSYPALTFFRSPDPTRSWVTAAGTILDAAALTQACIPGLPRGPAGVCIRAGYLCLRKVADTFGIEFDRDPQPTDPISITREEFDAAWETMAEADVPLVEDQDQAWRDFAGWRVNYDTVLLGLAQVTMAPYAPWTSDRSAVGLRPSKVRRFGRRAAGTR
jgi:hypothetical protein